MQGIKKIEFIRGIFVKQPVNHMAPHRSLESNFSTDIQNEFSRATRDGADVSSNALHSVANKIIMPSTRNKGERNIMGGWGEPRIAGYKLYKITTGIDVRFEVHIVYSDRADFSHGGHISPETTFTVDSRKVIGSSVATNIQTPSGGSLTKDFVLLKKASVRDAVDGKVRQLSTSLRPEDSLVKMQNIQLGFNVGEIRDEIAIDGTQAYAHDLNANVYMSKVCNSYKTAKKRADEENQGFGSKEALFGTASGMLEEENMEEGSILAEFKRKTQFIDNGVYQWFEFEDMFGAPGYPAEDRCEAHGMFAGMEDLRNEGGSMTIDTLESLLAFRINMLLAKELGARLISEAHVVIFTNSVGMPTAQVTHALKLFPDETDDNMFNRSIGELEGLIQIEFISMIKNYCDSFNIQIKATAFNYNDITISLDGRNPERFTPPTYCNGVISPLADVRDDGTNGMGAKDDSLNFADELKKVIDMVIDKDVDSGQQMFRPNATANLSFETNQTPVNSPRIVTNPNASYHIESETDFDQGFKSVDDDVGTWGAANESMSSGNDWGQI